MTNGDVLKLYEIWKFYRTKLDCNCPDHHPTRQKVCERELAWRAYTRARDEVYGLSRPRKEFDLEAVLDAFTTEHDN
jgi:hypothetical protein